MIHYSLDQIFYQRTVVFVVFEAVSVVIVVAGVAIAVAVYVGLSGV